jgi:uncharacterized membrane protein YqhA
MMQNYLPKFRYIFVIAVFFLMISSIAFMIAGVIECIAGYLAFFDSGFKNSGTEPPGAHLLEGLDLFVSSLVFMIFGMGLGQLFLMGEKSSAFLPPGLKVESLKELKVLLWETIIVALVIFCITHLLRTGFKTWDVLPFPILILILSLSLFLFKFEGCRGKEKQKEVGDE